MCDEALGVWRTAGGLKDRLMVKKRVVCFLQMKKQLDKSSERGFFFRQKGDAKTRGASLCASFVIPQIVIFDAVLARR